MKKILLVIVAIAFFFFAGRLYAQTATNSAQNVANKYGITFPIAELGNCADLQSCKTYCDDPNHLSVCIAFAKKKGFYKQPEVQSQDVLASAKKELGCDSPDSCKTFCEDSNNQEKCATFAKEHSLSNASKDPADNKTLHEAETALGCNSVDSCRAFCSQSQNQEKCSEFARKVGLKGGVQKVGPGGCSSETSCKAYCSDPANFQTCQQFTQEVASGSASGERPQFKGPGGCTSEDSCRQYCQQNPNVCNRLQSGLSLPNGAPSVMPSAFPSVLPSISKEDYCRMYPTHCAQPSQFPNQSNFPSQPPLLSPRPTTSSEGQKAYCESYAGCSWTGTSCSCHISGSGNGQPAPVLSPKPTNPPTNTSGELQEGSQLPPPPSPTNTQVRGIMTVRTFFQAVLDFFHFGR